MSKNGVNNPYLFDAGKVLIDDMAKATMNIKSANVKKLNKKLLIIILHFRNLTLI